MIKYTREFNCYWERTDRAAFGNAPLRVKETYKRVAYKAWQAARRPRVPTRKPRPGVPF